MKKVFVIADKHATVSQIEEIRSALLDPKKTVLVSSELFIKEVINIEFDEVEVHKEKKSFKELVDEKLKEPQFQEDRIG